MRECPELAVLEQAPSSVVREHVAACSSCRIVVELLAERRRGVEARDRRDECARFEMLLAARDDGSIGGTAGALLEGHLRECAGCQAVAATQPPAAERREHSSLPAVSTAAYALGREVARGGMGRILAAEDLRIGRPVAVKELLGKNPALGARFEREARVTARLQHPGIVPIYEIGQWPDGTPFYSMRMIEGRTLREAMHDKTLDERLALLPSIIAAADAVAFAHGKRIIHRDLTPNNVLVGEYGDTVVIDWGLAKDLSVSIDETPDAGPYRDAPAGEGLTRAGVVIGTAAYMPPEQASGKSVDERADVYSLGAIIYQVLAGEPPYKGVTSQDVLRDLKTGPPRPLDTIATGAPRDLVSIVDKAMARAPHARYANAGQLAAELRRFQTGQVVAAHAYSVPERTRRWIRGHRALVIAVAAVLVTATTIGVLAITAVLRERDTAKTREHEANTQRVVAQQAYAALLKQVGRQELEAGHPEAAAAFLSAAYSAGDSTMSLRFLLRSAMQNLESVERTVVGNGRPVRYFIFDRAGRKIAISYGSLVEQWSVTDGKKLASLSDRGADIKHVRYSTDAASLITYGDDPYVRVWDAETGRLVRSVEVSRLAMAFISDDGAQFLTLRLDGTATRWNTSSGAVIDETQLDPVEPMEGFIGSTRFLIGEMVDGSLAIWDWQRGGKPAAGARGWRATRSFEVDRSGSHFINCKDSEAHLWDETGHRLRTFKANTRISLCGFDLEGLRVVTTDVDGHATIWEAATGAVLSDLRVGSGPTGSMLLPGDRLLTASPIARDVNVRDALTGTLLASYSRAADKIQLDVDATRQIMAIGHDDSSVDIIRLNSGRLLGRFVHREHPDEEHDWGANSGHLITHRGDPLRPTSTLWDLRTSRAIATFDGPAKLNDSGSRVVGMKGNHAVVLDASSGQELARVAVETPVYALAIDEAAKRLVTTGEGTPVHVTNIADGKRIAEFNMDHCCPSLTPDGSHVLNFQWHKVARLYPIDGGAPEQLTAKPFTYAFDPHMRRVAWIDQDGDSRLVVLDLATRKRTELPGAGMSLSFDGSGDLLAVDRFSSIDVWKLSEKRKLISIEAASSRTIGDVGVSISPDGAFVATASGVWSTADGRQLATFVTPLRLPRANPGGEPGQSVELGAMTFSPDGKTALNFMPHGDVTLWDTSVETRSPAEIAAIVEQRVPWVVREGQLIAKPR